MESIACKSSADNVVECNAINSHVRDDSPQVCFQIFLKMPKYVLKKGDAMNVCNYRPVRILPIVSKTYEKEMVRQLENYLEEVLTFRDLERHIVAKQF